MQSGAIAVFSPLPLTEKVRDRLKTLGGNVQYIIAPSRAHHMFLHEWHTAFPSARIIGPNGLQEHIDKIKESEKIRVNRHVKQGETSGSVDAVFSQDFDMVSFDMVRSGDLVFRHIPSGSVIEADLFCNISRRAEIQCGPVREAYAFTIMKPPRLSQWVTWIFRGKSRLDSYAASVREIESWTFDRVIPCHGDIIPPENNAKARLISALRKGVSPWKQT